VSAFIVTNRTMDHVIAAITSNANYMPNRREDPDTIGTALFDLNARAVAGRYRDDTTAPAYAFDYPTDTTPIQQFKAVQCLSYQCSEDATIDDPLLAMLNDLKAALAGHIIAELPAYNAAKWDCEYRPEMPTAFRLTDLMRA